jgi:membrane-associated phospholipid phosphatase
MSCTARKSILSDNVAALALVIALFGGARAFAAPATMRPPPATTAATGAAADARGGDSRWKAYWKGRPASPFRLKVELELGLLLVSAPVWAMSHYINPQLDPPSCGQLDHLCDRAAVPAIDRSFIQANPDFRPISETLFSWAIPVIAVGLFLDYGPYRWDSYLTDLNIMIESLAVTAAITHLVRTTTRRPRPYLYVEGPYPSAAQRAAPDATLGFWSGHVSYLFGFGVSAAYLFTLRHGWRSPWTYVMWTVVIGAGVVEGVARVGAGDHFVTDVVVGAAVGAGVGLLVPLVHPRRVASRVALAPLVGERMNGLVLYGTF